MTILPFFENLQTLSDPNCASLILGDWNVVMDTKKDRTSNKKYYKPLSNVAIKNMAFEQDLVDPWRQDNMSAKLFSWEKWDKSQSSRIDYALINDKALTMHQVTNYYPPPFDTDHKRLQITDSISLQSRHSFLQYNQCIYDFHSQLKQSCLVRYLIFVLMNAFYRWI